MGRLNGAVKREVFEKLRERHDSYAVANQNQVQVIKGMRVELERARRDVESLSAELDAARTSLTLLQEKMTTKYNAGNREAIRLHGLLEQHGIDPGG